ncbi:unnamed protein product (macronuclear) [Paramecium tetraurelia]|uniref:Myb-like DNA-binding domain containing protein n=1 Tax=Paramecium tetraurelia TaxID=5888 RepID=A0BFW5_PARTE|nr:uncharacterized protein GSPATT00028467001 [Paramecium tetraurelia]CAK57432.1 unnamed protein product [Paramecium tetraurelia]|eukprot:XP_001424830.1 hypothetical protein (macronuclear) [Paramecium tetraurelia strain d4-2]
MRRKNWRPEEDKALLEICKSQNYNQRRVSKIMISMGYRRSGKSCKERFHNQLNPVVNKDQWTQNEVDKLFELQSKYGNRWRSISKELPQRTDGLIKNYFYSLVRKVLRRLSKTVNGDKNGSQMTKTLKPSVISSIFCVNQNANNGAIKVEFAQLFRNIILKYKNYNLSQQIDIEDTDKIKSIFQTLQQLNESYNHHIEKKNISKSRSKNLKLKTKLKKLNIDHILLQRIQLQLPIFTMKSCPLQKLYQKFQFHHNTYHPTQLMYQQISSFTSQNIDQNNGYGAILVKPEQLLFFQPLPSPYYPINISTYIQQQSSMQTYYSSFLHQLPEIKEEQET